MSLPPPSSPRYPRLEISIDVDVELSNGKISSYRISEMTPNDVSSFFLENKISEVGELTIRKAPGPREMKEVVFSSFSLKEGTLTSNRVLTLMEQIHHNSTEKEINDCFQRILASPTITYTANPLLKKDGN